MYADIVDLREFYASPLGHTVRRLLRARLAHIWPNIRGERVLVLGYGVPFLRPWLGQAESLLAMMPPEQGVSYWPREGPNLSCLGNIEDMPLADNSVDRIIMVHALEGAARPQGLLGEVWRVLRPSGRLLVMVANRRGLWAHSEHTPFGTGQPYSAGQIRNRLRAEGFLVERSWNALYAPPSSSRLTLSLAEILEKYGERLFPGFGGLLMLEAGKQLYAPTAARQKVSQRLLLPLPLQGMPNPASRSKI